jgi:hypothetical protein
MELRVLADRDIFEHAIEAAEQVGRGGKLKGLNAPDASLSGWLSEAWDAIREALASAREAGTAAVKELAEQSWLTVQSVLTRAGERADQLRELLIARLREYQRRFVDELMQQFRSEMTVGTSRLTLTQVRVSQKVSVCNSVKASMHEVIALTAQGELSIEASYEKVV